MPRFIYPVEVNISQGFGANPSYYKQFGQVGHNGIDLAQPSGTAIKASADGTVIFEGWGQNNGLMGSPAGICVIIDHGDIMTGYAHMTRTVVNKGQSVKQGQVIGYVGASGAASGPHVHFEFIAKPTNINNGYYGRVNPEPYLKQGGNEVEIIKSMYLRLLGREADQGGIDTYTKAAQKRGWDFVYTDLKNSTEGQKDWAWRNPDRVRQLEKDLAAKPKEIIVEKPVIKEVIKEVEVPVEVIKEVPVEVVKEVEVVKGDDTRTAGDLIWAGLQKLLRIK